MVENVEVHSYRETSAVFEAWKLSGMKRRKLLLQSKLRGKCHALGSTGMAKLLSTGTAMLKQVASRPDIIDLTEDSDDDTNEYVAHPERIGVHVKRNTQDCRGAHDKKRMNVMGRSSENSGIDIGDVKTQVSKSRISTAEGINYSQAMQYPRGECYKTGSGVVFSIQDPQRGNIAGASHFPSCEDPGSFVDHKVHLVGGRRVQVSKGSVGIIEGRENFMQSDAAYDMALKNHHAALSKSHTSLTKMNLDGSCAMEASLDEGLLSITLLRHQKVALAWMMNQELGGGLTWGTTGGILADDQGLGKTITTISLILKERAPIQKMPMDAAAFSCQASKTTRPAAGTLVVCPTSVLRQWAHELREKVTDLAGLSVLIYHGSNRTKDPDEVAKYDVVLTTYSIVSMEVPVEPLHTEESNDKDAVGSGDRDFPPSFRGASKAKKSKKAPENGKKSRGKGKGKGKLRKEEECSVHSGGPLARVHWFRVVLDEAQSIKNARTQAARAAWGLRAKRRWCLSGTPLQNAVDDLYSYFRFLRYDPYDSYKEFRARIKEPITRCPAEGYRILRRILSVVMLRRTKATKIDGQPIVNLPPRTVTLRQAEFSKEERVFYDNLESQSRKQFQDYAAAGTVQRNYMNILWMILQLRQACDHHLLVKGFKHQGAQKVALDSANKLPIEQRLHLLSILEGDMSICSICSDLPDEAVVCICGHIFCRQCISEQLATGDDNCCPLPKCRKSLNSSSVFTAASLKNSEPFEGSFSVRSLLLEHSQHEECKSTENMGWKSSSKIDAVMDILRALPPISVVQASNTETVTRHSAVVNEEKQEAVSSDIVIFEEPLKSQIVECTEKAIVFSQWTSMLDLLEIELKKSEFNYRRLDGTMTVLARDRAVCEFKTQPEVTVIIMSLKAASLGLNMVPACHVLLLDVWWNPTTEDQAIDRAHRIGQTRAVKVSRFTVKNTIEDKILALQEKKRLMVASVFAGKDVGLHNGGLSEEELEFLFSV